VLHIRRRPTALQRKVLDWSQGRNNMFFTGAGTGAKFLSKPELVELEPRFFRIVLAPDLLQIKN